MAETLETVKQISRDELKGRIDRHERVTILETLSSEHFEHAHLPGALNMPPERIKELAPVLVPDKQAEIVTYCAGPMCHASLDAAHELSALGYTNVRHYPGGKQEWAASGFPIERGEEKTSGS